MSGISKSGALVLSVFREGFAIIYSLYNREGGHVSELLIQPGFFGRKRLFK